MMRPNPARSLFAAFMAAFSLSTVGHPIIPACIPDSGKSKNAVTDTIPQGSLNDGKEPTDSVAPALADSTATDESLESGTRSDDFANGVITAPEQPEGTAFMPTMMGDIEAATPTAGINIIAPPSANNHGSASLQYPFIMPPARNGMSPTLGLAYDSDAGDGICGEGWTLPVSSITVDTRWGVPRYSTQKETETYLLDGQMLAMQSGSSLYLAHRNASISRNSSGNRRFHPRTGTDFSLIERSNYTPSTYTWKVTAPDGTEYTYGGGNATLKGTFTDASGTTREVIAEWLLSRVEDPHGDYVTFSYHTSNESSVGNLNSKAVYLDSIRAFLNDGTLHTVVKLFYGNRSSQDGHMCSARYGFLSSSNQLLDSVVVRFNGSYLRKYELQYASGRFGKPLLTRVIHYDDHRNVASFQDFSYYDDVTENSSEISTFSTEATAIPSTPTNIQADFAHEITDDGAFSSHPTTLGGNKGKSFGTSLYAGVGFGVSNDKANTAGFSVGFSRSSVTGAVTLADINGDGMPDQVYRLDGNTYYRPLTISGSGLSFGPTVMLGSTPEFSRSVTTSITGGLKGHVGIGVAGIAETGVDLMNSTTKTTSYMTDANGDGLTDIVSNGTVYFCHLNTQGIPSFSTTSSSTPNPISNTGTIIIDEASQLAAERDTLIKYSPMQDVVRMWKAPFAGTVNITGTALLQIPANPTDENGDPVSPDGVFVSIQKTDIVLYSAKLDTSSTQVQANCSNVTVNAGDTIFFRVQCGRDSLSNGYHDKVIWQQTVKYVNSGLSYPTMPNGENQNIFRSGNAAFVSSGSLADVGGSSFMVKGTLRKGATTDILQVRIWTMNAQYDDNGNPNPSYHRTLAISSPISTAAGNYAVNLNIPNSSGDPYAVCEVYSTSNVNWAGISWTPEVIVGADTAVVIPHLAAYPLQRWRGAPYRATSTDSLIITPSLGISGTHSVNMTVKKKGGYMARKRLEFVNGTMTGADNTVRVKPAVGDSIWVEYFIEDDQTSASTSQPSALFKQKNSATTYSRNCNLFQYTPEPACGTMYGGWGVFAYGAGDDRFSRVIDRSLLALPNSSGTTDPLDMALMPLSPRLREGTAVWEGANASVYICGDTLSAARLTLNDVNPQAAMQDISTPSQGNGSDGSEGRGITLKTSSSSTAEMSSLGITPLSLSMSESSGSSSSSTAFTDMNGDGYPDIISGGNIQYTNTLGGFSNDFYNGLGIIEEASNWLNAPGHGAAPQHSHTLSGRHATGSSEVSSQQASNANFQFGSDYPNGSDEVRVMLIDINGDGLPDRVRNGGGSRSGAGSTLWVRLNLGYTFSPEQVLTTVSDGLGCTEHFGCDASAGISLPSGYDHGATSFAGGLGTSATQWDDDMTLFDVNGDGLPDLVRRVGNGAKAFLNNGMGFFSSEIGMAGVTSLGSGSSTTMSANVAATLSFNVLGVKTAITPSAHNSATMTRTTAALRDIDGDGFPDIVTSYSENGISVRFSTIRRTNKLKTVSNSLGGAFTLDYAHSTPTYGLPGGKWVMSSVEVDRGIHFSGCDIPVTRKAFTYTGGVRDRREREFLGFAEVVTTDLDALNDYAAYRSVQETFDVSSYYRRGLPLATTLRDASDNKFTETENIFYIYSVRPNSSNKIIYALNTTAPSDTWPMAYTPIKFTENRNYEGGSNIVKSQSGYSYHTSTCGEVACYYHSSSGMMPSTGSSFTGYDYRTIISYSSTLGNTSSQLRRTISRPTLVVVTGGNGTLYHRTSATYLDNQNAAKASSIVRNYSASGSDTINVKFTYNQNTGNLKSMSQYSGSRTMSRSYSYDEDYLNTYPYQIKDQHQLETDIEGMDLRYGLQTLVEDPNSSVLHTIYDGLGRLESVKSPNEQCDSSTIDMSYSPIAVMKADGTGIQTPAHAVTTYHLRQPYESGNSIFTHCNTMRVVTFTDGFGQVLQTRRESMIDSGTGSQSKKVVIGGGMAYDGLGRVVKEFYPTQADSATLMTYQPTAQTSAYFTETGHDVLDRPTSVTTADGAVTQFSYGISNGSLRTTVIDALGRQSETYTDATGKTLKTVMFRDVEACTPIETCYGYDAIGRLTTVINAAGDSTLITYDMLDRRTMVRHPASGTNRWTYDKLGNVLTEENETLRAQGEKIRYTWDVDRLMKVACPEDTVTYHYGSSSDGLTNTIGRPNFRLDRSGGTEYGYDAMGNISYEKRSVVVPGKGIATFETEWEYDSYGKLLNMTYPGDEKLVYRYNDTGDLKMVYRGKESSPRYYVSSIGYDCFGHRVRIAYANGTSTRFFYNAQTRRLSSVAFYKGSTMKASNSYTYDLVGNITVSSGSRPNSQSFEYRYSYDALNRLSSATQRYGNVRLGLYATDTLSMSYDDLWRITSKSQRLSQTGLMFPGTLNTGYSMTYNYDTAWGRHYRMKNVGETHYRTTGTPSAADNVYSTHWQGYDANGNLSSVVTDRRRDSQNVTDNVSERKMSWDSQNRLRGLCDNGYVSLYCYDADGNRTVKEHLGGEAVWVNGTSAGQTTDTLAYSVYPNAYISINGDRWTKHYYIGGERVASRTGILSDGFNSLSTSDNNSAGFNLGINVDYDNMCHAEEDSIAAMYERFEVPYDVQHAETRRNMGHLYIPITRDNDGKTESAPLNRNHPHINDGGLVYFFHRDHLGSTLSVNDSLGAYVQQVEYTPWGEVFVEKYSGNSGYETPYLFNGKELDEETGLYYYGARYYDPKMSVWYSVDRFGEKYPLASPYNFCACNPLIYLDPNGDSIKAVSRISGYRLVNEIHNTFQGERFDKLNSLFQLSNDGKTMKGIRRRDFLSAIRNLNSDEKALAIGYYKAINSKDIHYVDMTLREECLNPLTIGHFSAYGFRTGRYVDELCGGGVNTKAGRNGSFTIVIMNSVKNVDFVYVSNGVHYNRRSTPAEILAHELLGHGLSGSFGIYHSSDINAIQMTNLYWRVRGYHGFYRDGTDHHEPILSKSKAINIPYYLINH